MGFTVEYRISNGTVPYTAVLTSSGLPNNVHQSDGTYSFINVPEGTYSLDVTDSLGCSSSLPVVLVATVPTTSPPIPTCNLVSFQALTTTATNNDGTITVVSVVGGQGTITYSVDGGQNYQPTNIFTGLAPDTYSVCIMDDFITNCVVCQPVNVYETIQLPEFSASFQFISPDSNAGSGNGTQGNPYPSNVVINFNVIGNGGTGGSFPVGYTLKVNIPATAQFGVGYQGSSYNNSNLLQLTSPRGILDFSSEADQFNGGWGSNTSEHSILFYNSGLGSSEMGLILLVDGVEHDRFSIWVDNGEGAP